MDLIGIFAIPFVLLIVVGIEALSERNAPPEDIESQGRERIGL